MQSFPIEPGSIKWLVITSVVGFGILLVVGTILALSFWGARHASFTVDSTGLRLSGDLYGRLVPLANIETDSVRRVDFTQEPGLRPHWRTMGTGLPGYQAGWFRLKDGTKALVYMTSQEKAVLVPTTLGYSVLLSPRDPDGLVAALKSLAGKSAS